MARTEIKVSGFGGQGVIKSGYIIGKAASIFDKYHATLTQSFGPEARGSACSAQVIVDSDPILYPYLKKADILVTMSQEAYDKFSPELKENGLLLIDTDLVTPQKGKMKAEMYDVPATRFAEELGNKIVLNIVMLGFFTSISQLLDYEAVQKAVKTSVPARTIDLNMSALEKGYQHGMEQLNKKGKSVGNKKETKKKAKKGK